MSASLGSEGGKDDSQLHHHMCTEFIIVAPLCGLTGDRPYVGEYLV